MFDIDKIRAEFPILSREVNGRPLVYLDNGASAQKPRCVIEAMTRFYEHDYANVHRGLHTLSTIATEAYEGVRGKIARFIGAPCSFDRLAIRATSSIRSASPCTSGRQLGTKA